MAVGIAMALRLVPFLFFGPLGGFLADRYSRRTILMTADFFRIVFAVSFVFIDSASMIWLAYVSSFFLAAGEAIYAPARRSSIPFLVKSENLQAVNGLEQVMLGAVLIAGSVSGGIVTFFFGPDVTFWLNGFSFLAAACLLYQLPAKYGAEKEEGGQNRSFIGSIKTVKQVVSASAILFIIFLFELTVPVFNGIDNVLISVYAVQEFRLGDMGVGLFYGSLGTGLVLSFLVSPRIKSRFLQIGIFTLFLEGIFLILLSTASIPAAASLLFVLMAFVSGIGNACFDSLIMKESPKHHQGMIFGFLSTMSNTLMGLSMLGAGILLEWIPNRVMGMLGGAGFVMIGCMLMVFYLLRKNKGDMRKNTVLSMDKKG